VRDIDAAADALRGERDLVSYMDERPGSVSGPGTALFDQGGPVTLADARRGIERAEGAVCCTEDIDAATAVGMPVFCFADGLAQGEVGFESSE
jgi:hypothetical protein